MIERSEHLSNADCLVASRSARLLVGLALGVIVVAGSACRKRVTPRRGSGVAGPSATASAATLPRASAGAGGASTAARAANSAGDASAKTPLVAEARYPGLLSEVLSERNAALLDEMRDVLALDPDEVKKLREIFESSKWLGQGNPKITEHPLTRGECRARREAASALPAGDPRCKSANMVPIYDPSAGESATDARVCIDQYEFPNIPCEYPVVWVRADQAVSLCRAEGKRICDAHEWEGACAGALKKPEGEYAFGQRRLMIEYLHNKEREIVWAYGKEKDHSKCATNGKKSKTCDVIDWGVCGSNTFPAGAFPECRSSFGVFDQHGNAAEHMNMPLVATELASRGGLGETEMKGSWFIFSSYEAHADDCRWRAPMWHMTRIDDPASHRNYHLGFRCCKDI
jgi:sulfatase modifying factor 1